MKRNQGLPELRPSFEKSSKGNQKRNRKLSKVGHDIRNKFLRNSIFRKNLHGERNGF